MALHRLQKRTSPVRLISSKGDTANSTDDQEVSAALVWREREISDAVNDNVIANNMRRYLRATRALYELQFQMKRPLAILKMKPNLYALKNLSTFDALPALLSPLRAPQILDDWTGLEIGLFEEAYERFGKDFYAIAALLPQKSLKDTIAFYYIWKKNGSFARSRDDGNLSDVFLPEPEPDISSGTLKLIDCLRKRQNYMQDYLDAARTMYAPQPLTHASNRKRQKLSEFGLQKVGCFQRGLVGLSPLRASFVLDTWTPFEVRVFEVAIECYGKDFSRIAEQIHKKSCGEVIAFYYLWKSDVHYQVVKHRLGKKSEGRATKKTLPDTKSK
ncbi:hypothetical protein PHYSODRAFT_310883 [Plasmopara halstedii]|uniref:SANT domain-containing protein n=1 Tax=Plasmopara halstedii TaxID=4781 RepID=A0A0P1AH44_PLAHL|nr:hypothetical protein PHYSODRAFT_310883 [Plasmopara halstedii]CEG40039.1 hypothetical protein PHYSODRAFT_310883 [Plasmopara halstedii]|eukprot:XP_024576408.1 hypothetical protein PHYSODRAFT_310883 [Plasmopara halstedii]